MKRLQQLALAAASASLIISIPQRVQALSLACCSSLDEMEQSSDLIVTGKALSGIDDVEERHFSEAEYQAHLATGEQLPIGVSVIVHDEKWQFVTGYTTLPVKVTTVLRGETTEQIIDVAQQDDWGATPMVEGAEYLLFLSRSLHFELSQPVYYDFYSQGKYNIDGTDTTAGSPAYYNIEEVRARYSDRIDFTPLSMKRRSASWIGKVIKSFRQWLVVE